MSSLIRYDLICSAFWLFTVSVSSLPRPPRPSPPGAGPPPSPLSKTLRRRDAGPPWLSAPSPSWSPPYFHLRHECRYGHFGGKKCCSTREALTYDKIKPRPRKHARTAARPRPGNTRPAGEKKAEESSEFSGESDGKQTCYGKARESARPRLGALADSDSVLAPLDPLH